MRDIAGVVEPLLVKWACMQFLQAGKHKMLLLELDTDLVTSIAKQTGFEYKLDDSARSLVMDLTAAERESPLLLFDAADPGNLGWFSRCQFYVDGSTGAILQTPLFLANLRDRTGHTMPNAVRIQITKELPAGFRMPGKQAVTEQMIYAVLFNILNALQNVGVGVCGGALVKPLAGRSEVPGSRN